MPVSVERINEAAKILGELSWEGTSRELGAPTHFLGTASQLRRLAEIRTPKPFKPKVYVKYAEDDSAVYIEKPDGDYVAVYVASIYENGGVDVAMNREAATAIKGELVFGG